MPTVINDPTVPVYTNSDRNSAFFMGVLITLLIIVLLYLGVPYLRGMTNRNANSTNTSSFDDQVTPTETPVPSSTPVPSLSPAPSQGGTQINLPDRINVTAVPSGQY